MLNVGCNFNLYIYIYISLVSDVNVWQSLVLYVYDPVALYHIVVKDQSIYEELHWFIAYVSLYFLCGFCVSMSLQL